MNEVANSVEQLERQQRLQDLERAAATMAERMMVNAFREGLYSDKRKRDMAARASGRQARALRRIVAAIVREAAGR